MLNKLILAAIVIIGAILLGFEIWLERQVAVCKTLPSSTFSGLLRALQIISAIMIVVPVILLVIDYATVNRVSTMDLALPASFLMAGLSAVLLIIVGALQASLPDGCADWPNWVWIPVGGLAAASFSLLFYRWKSKSSSTPISKNKVDWNNPAASETLIRELGRRQAKECGITMEPDDALAAFAYYVQTHQAKKGFWASLVGSKTILPESTKEKFPNILKMYSKLRQSAQGQKSWAAVKIPTPRAPERAIIQSEAFAEPQESTLDTLSGGAENPGIMNRMGQAVGAVFGQIGR